MAKLIKSPMETIPIEVGALILEYVPDMASLWAFIRASPHISSAFRDYRKQILPIVIARDIGPILVVEALAALDSSRFTTFRNVDEDDVEVPIRGPPKSQALGWMENYYLPRSGVMRWVDRYLTESDRHRWEEWKESHQAEESDKSPSNEDMLPLWKLHQDVKFIADLYVREVLPIFAQGFRSVNRQPAPQIQYALEDASSIERQRIFRGIYRFVIFGNLFAPSAEVWGSEELCENFLCRFQGWEVEEISCINDFIRDRIAQKWKELGDCEFERLINSPDIGPESDETHERHGLQWKLAFASALPIQDLRAMFQAKGELLKSLVLKWTSVDQDVRPFLEEALFVDPEFQSVIYGSERPRSDADTTINDSDRLKFDEEKGDEVNSPSLGICWGTNWYGVEMYCYGTSRGHWRGEDYEGYRRAGYVFWEAPRWGDHTRL